MVNCNRARDMLIGALVGIAYSLLSFLAVILLGSAFETRLPSQKSSAADSN